MKKRRIAKILAATLGASTAIAVVSCGSKKTSNYTITYNSDQGTAPETVKGKELTTDMLPSLTAEGYRFVGWYLDADYETAATAGKITGNVTLYARWVQTVTLTFNSNGGSAVTSITVDKGATAEKPTDPTLAENTFDGWYTDEALTTPFVWTNVINASQTLYAKWIAEGAASGSGIDIPEGYELVQNELTFNDKTYDATNGTTLGNVYLYKGAEKIDTGSTKSVEKYDGTKVTAPRFKMKGATSGITVDAAGATVGETLGDVTAITEKAIKVNIPGINAQLDVAVAAAGTGGRSIVILDSNGKVVYSKTTAESTMFLINLTDLEGGDYYIVESNGYNFYYIGTKCAAEKADVSNISVTSAGTTKFFAGTDFNTNGLSVSALKSNGASQALTDAEITVDSSAVKMDTPGTYTVKITYGNFETSYDVTVYALADMEVGLNKIVKLSTNTAAGNGQYFNYAAQQVYGLNDALDGEGVTVIGYAEANGFLERFEVDSKYVTVSEVDTTTAGAKEVTITLTLNGVARSETLVVYVVDTAIATVKNDSNEVTEANVYVDQNYEGVIGAQQEIGSISKTCNMFTTIQQALDYLGMQDGLSTVRKNIYVAAGTYYEKLEFTLPYTSLIGVAGAEKTIIEWDSVFGIADEGGFLHTTDSTQTVAVRDTAVGAVFDGVTISNFYNNITAYDGTAYEGSGERGLAMLAQADQMIVQNCKLLGWQDTLELFTGRQYFKNTYISGCVDYIFGTNNTTLFEQCEIHTIKSKTSNTDDTKTTAYVTAFKGCNKGDTDAITYGAIFNDCDFTVSDDFIGKIAVGRNWDKYAAVAILNSRLCDKFETSCSKAIVKMNADNTLTTLQYWFYNNTKADGETAFTFTEDITGGITNHVLTKEQADKYIDKSVIFGAENRGVTWNTAWDPSYTGIVVDSNIYYDFGAMSSTTGTVYTYDYAEADPVDTTFNGLTINTSKCKAFGQYTEVQSGTMTIAVEAGTTLSVKTGYGTNSNLNINGYISTTDTLTQYFATAQTVTINFTGKVYVLGIKVSTTEDAPATLAATSITATSAQSVFALNDTFATTGLIVNEYYNNGTYKVLTADDYTIDSTAVDMTTSGTYTVTITAGTLTASYDVMVGVDTSISTDTVLKFNSTYAGTVENQITWANNKVTGTQDGFTIAGSSYTNSGYLEFKNDDTITFDIAIPDGMKAVIVISGYNGVAPTVTVGTTNVTGTQTGTASHDVQYTYEVTTSGTVTIAATTSQEYLNFVSITFVAA